MQGNTVHYMYTKTKYFTYMFTETSCLRINCVCSGGTLLKQLISTIDIWWFSILFTGKYIGPGADYVLLLLQVIRATCQQHYAFWMTSAICHQNLNTLAYY